MRSPSILKIFQPSLLVITLILSWSCSNNTLKTKEKPNIVIILSDDQGWGDFSIHGNKNLSTPNIDQLAKEGSEFDNFYVSTVCSPTRAEFLTGRYHERGGVYSTSEGGERLDLDEETIAQIFKKSGYVTAIYGKWHNGTQYPYHPNGRGFDDFYGFTSGHWGNYFSPMLEHNGQIIKGNGFLTNDITNHALTFIKKQKDHPFFLYIAYNVPHAPMQVPDIWYEKFEKKELSMLADSVSNENKSFTKAALAMCENMDWNVGRIEKTLDSLQINKNTIVVFFNDNGPNSYRWNGKMKGKKGSLDEGGLRSPLFVKWPGKIQNGKKINQLAGAIDIFPTLIDLANIPMHPKHELDGISLKDFLLKTRTPEIERFIISEWKSQISVRNQKYRLDKNNLLFNIEKDRSQKIDVSKDYPQIKKALLTEKYRFKNEIQLENKFSDKRSFLIGHPDSKYTQIPARDGLPHGNIRRSNKFPNCSFFTNWKSKSDFISWPTKVIKTGEFKITLYYTCSKKALNSEYELSLGNRKIKFKITDVFDPPLYGMKNDRVKRNNSYVKDWKSVVIGNIDLDQGKNTLFLKSISLPKNCGIDVRLLLFERT